MAQIRKRGARWQARIQRRGEPEISRSFLLRSDAERWARQVEIALDNGTYQQQTELPTLAELLERYRTDVTPRKKGARREVQRLDLWAKDPLAGKRANTIRAADVAKYRDARLAAGAANGTIRLDLALLSHVFTVARQEWGYEGLANPVATIRRPAPGKGRERRLQAGEIERVVAAMLHPEMPAVVSLAMETAMRLGELLSMRRERVQLERRIAVLEDSKNGERRVVPLSTAAAKTIEALPLRLDGRLFSLRSTQVTDLFRSAVKRARGAYEEEQREKGIGADALAKDRTLIDLHFHDLRHEAVSRLFEHGLDAMEVASVSGHKTLAMLKRYTHMRAENLARKLG